MVPVDILPVIWAGIVCFSLVMYAALDGFDLGAAWAFAAARTDAERDRVMETIEPFWDGNETWLIVLVTAIFGAFPAAYALLLPALYMPVFIMLMGLVFRGVAFEFRVRSQGSRVFWNAAFVAGSLVAAFFQGVAFGAVVHGVVPAAAGGMVHLFDWISPVPLIAGGFTLALYGLIGSSWVAARLEQIPDARRQKQQADQFARYALTILSGLILAFFLLAVLRFTDAEHSFFLARLGERLRFSGEQGGATGAGDMTAAGIFWVTAGLSALAYLRVIYCLRRPAGYQLFVWSVALMAGLLLLFCATTWPYIIPPELTVYAASAPASSQAFLLAGTAIVIPLILAYTVFTYAVFLKRSG